MHSTAPSHQQSTSPLRTALLAGLREKIHGLEETQRRFTCTIPVSVAIDEALPYKGLPLGCVHEVKGTSLASAIAFAFLLSARIPAQGSILYVAPDRSFYPLGVLPYGVRLDRCIHVSAQRSKDLVWTVLEALRCSRVSAVLAVVKNADLTLCRRFQLAAEGSGATGFLLGDTASTSIASVITRWRVSPVHIVNSLSRQVFNETSWSLELQYCRGGYPKNWTVTWRDNKLEVLSSFSETATKSNVLAAPSMENVVAG